MRAYRKYVHENDENVERSLRSLSRLNSGSIIVCRRYFGRVYCVIIVKLNIAVRRNKSGYSTAVWIFSFASRFV